MALLMNAAQMQHTIERIAIEILEHNYHETDILLAGINHNGKRFAERLRAALAVRAPHIVWHEANIQLNPADPAAHEVSLSIPIEECRGRVVIIIDDVANTGRALFFALKPFLATLPRKVEVAVLVDRKHKAFPISPDYVGLSLSTTLQEHISVTLEGQEQIVLD